MTTPVLREAVFIDPSTDHFLLDKLFDTTDGYLTRDGTLMPFARMREELAVQGIPVHTADYLRSGEVVAQVNHYWSLGILNGYHSLLNRDDVRLRGFILFEPPLVAPHMYRALGEITKHFEAAYVHNTTGDGYSLHNVAISKLRKLYWPQPYDTEAGQYWWREERQNKLVVIAGNHNPWFRSPELYSRRIEAIADLADRNAIDLFGRGWDQWWSRSSAWLPYWRHRKALMKVYQGACESKLETLSRYRFCLCLENMPMAGYLTEKIFDCLYAGTVPIYLGAPNIADLIPPRAYVDLRQYKDINAMFDDIAGMSSLEWQKMRDVGKEFLRTTGKRQYYNFTSNLFNNKNV
jgi:hypothetical protein